MSVKITHKFRAQLLQEIQTWKKEGVIDASTHEQIINKYALHELARESSGLGATVVLYFGALLIGGGVISFVAANWDEFGPVLKTLCLVGGMLGFYAAGFWYTHAQRPRLGQALIASGCLFFGANFGLLGQMFHVEEDWPYAFILWSLGVLGMAWAVRSALLGSFALFLSIFWAGQHIYDRERLLLLYPVGVALAVLPLALKTRNKVLYGATWLSIILAFCFIGASFGRAFQAVLYSVFAAALWVWAEGEYRRTRGAEELGLAATELAVLAHGFLAYVGSFRSSAQELFETRLVFAYEWIVPALLAAVFAGAMLFKAWRTRPPDPQRLNSVKALAAGMLVLLLAGVSGSVGDGVLMMVLCNFAAAMFGAVSVWSGVRFFRKTHFWRGVIYLMILVGTRFLEYETSGLAKSIFFTVCGVTLLVLGSRYEQHVKQSRTVVHS